MISFYLVFPECLSQRIAIRNYTVQDFAGAVTAYFTGSTTAENRTERHCAIDGAGLTVC